MNLNNVEKYNNQAPLTPVYQKKKSTALISMRKNTERQYQGNNNSNPSQHNVNPTQ